MTVVARATYDALRQDGLEDDMPLFMIERNFLEEIEIEGIDRDEIKLVNDDVGVQWVYSFLSADKKKTYCLYEAPSAEAIREASARLGIPADVIVPVDQFGPVAPG